jgi:hypothetical protein
VSVVLAINAILAWSSRAMPDDKLRSLEDWHAYCVPKQRAI